MDNIMCDSCIHAEVCRYQERFWSITEKIKEFNPVDGIDMQLSQFDWIDCTPSCKYYKQRPQGVLRNGEKAL